MDWTCIALKFRKYTLLPTFWWIRKNQSNKTTGTLQQPTFHPTNNSIREQFRSLLSVATMHPMHHVNAVLSMWKQNLWYMDGACISLPTVIQHYMSSLAHSHSLTHWRHNATCPSGQSHREWVSVLHKDTLSWSSWGGDLTVNPLSKGTLIRVRHRLW